MASTDAKQFAIKNQAYRVTFPIMDADGDLVTGATGLDSEISKDGGTFTDCGSEATEIATASGMYYLDLTNTEMNADTVAIIVKTTSSGAKTTAIVLYPLEAGDIIVNAAQWAGSATATSNVALKNTLAKTTDITGFNDISTANVQTELTTYGALKPTTAGRTLDVTTGGEAGVDWANIGAPTTTVALTGTTVGTVTNLTNDPPGVTTLLARITSTLFTGITSLAQWLGMIAGKQVGNTTARTEMRATGAGSGAYDETTDSQEAIRDRGDASWITGAGGDPWSTAVPGAYAAGTAGNILGNRLDAAISTRATPAQVQTELGTYGALKPTTAGRTLDITVTGEAGIDLDNTAGTLAKGTELTGFNDLSAANVQGELVTYGALKPTVAARTLDVSTTGEAGIDWANIGAPTTTQNLSATTISTSQTVGSVTNPVTLTAAYDAAKTAATQASVTATPDQVWAKTMTELASVPGVTASALSALQWVFLLSRNKITQTATTQTVRNDADSATIGTSTVSDDGTTFVRGKLT